MISVTDALAFITAVRPIPSAERVSLNDALGRTLSRDVTAMLTQPPLSASAMDGYAVQLSDIARAGNTLNVIGEAPAGAPFMGAVQQGEAVRIFTGGAMPDGADTVIIQENVTRANNAVTVVQPQSESRHIRREGIDFHTDDTVIAKGTIITAAEICVAAAAGHGSLPVLRPLRVAILSGGDELCEPGNTPLTGQVVNANPPALAALIKGWGAEPVILDTAKDRLDSITTRINAAKDADIILPVGGASVGDHDHMRAAFTAAGLSMIFEKVAVRPGKPTWFGTLDTQVVLGLPGNPASALVCAHLFLRPLLGRMNSTIKARLITAQNAGGPRESYDRAIAHSDDTGQLWVTPLPRQDSGLMSPFLRANALLIGEVDALVKAAGDIVDILPLDSGPTRL